MTDAAGVASVDSHPRPERSRAWLIMTPLSIALLGFVVFFAGLRIARSETVFYYTEGVVLGSLAALEDEGVLAAMYPADGWQKPPTVLTLYPPAYFLLSAAFDGLAGTGGGLLGPRVISVLALGGVLLILGALARRARVPIPWFLALLAATLVTPGVYTVSGAAQADVAALLWTWIGVAAILHEPDDRRLLVAAVAFLLAFFTKQSFVAAPAALTVTLLVTGRRAGALVFAGGLIAAALVGILLLDRLTAGGYTANTVGALAGGIQWANLTSTVKASEPVQWIPLSVAVLISTRGRLRPGFPEIYLLAATALHTAAMLKVGSSVNYLLEPTFALLLLAVCRFADSPSDPPRTDAPSERRLAPVVTALLVLAIALPAGRAAWRELPTVRGWRALEGPVRMASFEGYPLTDVDFFPAVLAHGRRPWLNDPFAFGALEETGSWDPTGVVKDLESRTIPFVLTIVDIGPAPAASGEGSAELVMAYFWRSREIWSSITDNYHALQAGPLFLWLPVDDPPAGAP